MQNRPICLKCTERIDNDPVFEAVCGHPECPSAVFHGLCLMEFRDEREAATKEGRFKVVGMLMRRVTEEHTEAERDAS